MQTFPRILREENYPNSEKCTGIAVMPIVTHKSFLSFLKKNRMSRLKYTDTILLTLSKTNVISHITIIIQLSAFTEMQTATYLKMLAYVVYE